MKVTHRSELTRLKKDEHVILFIDDKTKGDDKMISGLRGSEFIKDAELSSFKSSASDIFYFNLKDRPGVVLCGLGDIT